MSLVMRYEAKVSSWLDQLSTKSGKADCHFTPGRFYYPQTDPGELFHLFPAFVLG